MQIENTLQKLWSVLRALSGEDSYERYRAHWREHHGLDGEEPPSREAFFKAELERKWSGVKRCC